MEDLIKLKGICKSFGTNKVLQGIDISIKEGDVKAIIGGNGAGKSTLMKILMGIYSKDKGEIYIKGEKVNLSNPSHALEAGIYLVPQEPLLFPNMSVEENIIIGFKKAKFEIKDKLNTIIEHLGWEIDLRRKADTLSIAEQQLVEILRGLLRESRILIFDEPTSALTFNEVESFFRIIKELQSKNIGMFYITHRLSEVFEIATDVVILKNGKIIIDGPVSEFTPEILVNGLMPDGVQELKEKELSYKPNYDVEPIFKVNNLTGYGFRDVSFEVYKGEILGLAGVVGSGRTEIAEAIFGKGEIISGDVSIENKDIKNLKTTTIVNLGLNYVPEDRHLNGLFKNTDVRTNITSGILSNISKVFVKRAKESEVAAKYIEDFRIKVTGQKQMMKSLSGGNQQKVVIARILASNPKVIILDEPTRGIDAGARGDVYKIIESLRKSGLAILLISSDFEEIYELCDRAVIMNQGTDVLLLKKEEITMATLTEASFGARE